MPFFKSAALGLTAVGLSLGLAASAQADVLPVQNLAFNQFTGTFGGKPKNFFTTVNPNDWSIGAPAQQSNLIYVGTQGSEGYSSSDTGNIYGVYTNPGFSNTVPAGTNFYQADGNPEYESTIYQTINGLTANTTYTLQFQQAAGQQNTYSGLTHEQWLVFLGQGDISVNCTTNPCSVVNPNGDEEEASTLMTTPSEMNVDWNSVNLSFTPTAANLTNGSAVLTFLAWGDNGSTTNLPPTVFLEGVNTTPVVPEPATLSVLGVGLLGLGAVMMRRRAKQGGAAA